MNEFLRKLGYALHECRMEGNLKRFGELKSDVKYVTEHCGALGNKEREKLERIARKIRPDENLRNIMKVYLMRHGVGIYELDNI